MSGHSKWAQIKRQKGTADVRRGQAFTKVSNAITLAVRQGGGIGDPEQNFRLRLTIEKARSINMPKENIERAIERGKGKGIGDALEEAVYEGFGPGGVSIIVEAASDKKVRTTSEIKNIFEKNGATLGTPGSVAYQYETKGQISVRLNGKTSDELFLLAADSGAQDIEEAGEELLIYTKPEDLTRVKEALLAHSIRVEEVELIRKPLTILPISDEGTAQKVLALIEKLENHDDVQKVYTNFDIPDRFIKQ